MVGPANISAFRPMLKLKVLPFIPNKSLWYYDPHSETTIDPPFGSLICHVGNAAKRFAQVFERRGSFSVLSSPLPSCIPGRNMLCRGH